MVPPTNSDKAINFIILKMLLHQFMLLTRVKLRHARCIKVFCWQRQFN